MVGLRHFTRRTTMKIKNAIERVLEKTLYADGAQLVLDALVPINMILTVIIVTVTGAAIAYRGLTVLLS